MFTPRGNCTTIRRRRRMLTIMARMQPRKAKPSRLGIHIQGWTEGMANRMATFIANFRQDFVGMLTLTYPDTYPKDGRIVKAHLRAFTERLRRAGCLKNDSFVWFLEFQQRGAPHFHLLLTGWIPKSIASSAWAQVTGGNPLTCTRIEALRSPEAAGAYARKYALKSDQKIVPDDYLNVGRFWGCCGARWKEENFRLLPRVPRVEASTAFPLYMAREIVLKFKSDYRAGRFYETEAGLVFYGTPEETETLWRYLQDAGLFVGKDATSNVKSLPKPSAALQG